MTEENSETCPTKATFDDGSPDLVCVREPHRSPSHRAADGTRFVSVGQGFIVSELSR